MPDHPDNDDLASVNDLTPEEVNRIIHSHRKVRYGMYECANANANVPFFVVQFFMSKYYQ